MQSVSDDSNAVDFSSPQQKGWAKFKQNRPDDFPFQQPRRMSMEINFTMQGMTSSVLYPEGKYPTIINNSDLDNILQQAHTQLMKGRMSHHQYQELQKQLKELQRIQTLMADIKSTPNLSPTSQNFNKKGNKNIAPSFQEICKDKKSNVLPMKPPPPIPKVLEGGCVRKQNHSHVSVHTQAAIKPALLETPANKKPLLEVPPELRNDTSKPALETRKPLHYFSEQPIVKKALLEDPDKSSLASPKKALLGDGPLYLEKPAFQEHRELSNRFPMKANSARPSENLNFHQSTLCKERGKQDFIFYEGKTTSREAVKRKFKDVETKRYTNKFSHRQTSIQSESEESGIPVYDTKKYYVAEHDPRWMNRKKYFHIPNINVYELVVDGIRVHQIRIGGHSRMIPFTRDLRLKVSIDRNTMEVFVNNKCYTRVGEPERVVIIGGRKFTILVRGQLKKFWIDGHPFELRVDAQASLVNIAGKSHEMRLDGRMERVFVDCIGVCSIDLTQVLTITIQKNKHFLQFFPPTRKILINGQFCELNLARKFPTVVVNGKEHGIRFNGPPRSILLNGNEYEVPLDKPAIVKLGGKGKPYMISIGGPGHEVIIDEYWFEVKFGGASVSVTLGAKKIKVQLPGPIPDVRILGISITLDELKIISKRELDQSRKKKAQSVQLYNDQKGQKSSEICSRPSFPQCKRFPELQEIDENKALKDSIPEILEVETDSCMQQDFLQNPSCKLSFGRVAMLFQCIYLSSIFMALQRKV